MTMFLGIHTELILLEEIRSKEFQTIKPDHTEEEFARFLYLRSIQSQGRFAETLESAIVADVYVDPSVFQTHLYEYALGCAASEKLFDNPEMTGLLELEAEALAAFSYRDSYGDHHDWMFEEIENAGMGDLVRKLILDAAMRHLHDDSQKTDYKSIFPPEEDEE